MICAESIESISLSISGRVIKPGKIKSNDNFSKPSDLKNPSREIGSWYMVLIPQISDSPFQARIHSVRGGNPRVEWPDKYSGIFCYPYTMDNSVDRILIEPDKDYLKPIKSYLLKFNTKFSLSEDSIAVGRYLISVDTTEPSIVVARMSDTSVVATFPYTAKGIEQAVRLAKKSRNSKEFEALSDPVDISDDVYEVDVKRDPLYSEIEDA